MTNLLYLLYKIWSKPKNWVANIEEPRIRINPIMLPYSLVLIVTKLSGKNSKIEPNIKDKKHIIVSDILIIIVSLHLSLI